MNFSKHTALIILVLALGCKSVDRERNEKFLIVTTTNILADAVRHIVKDSAEVQSLMAIGVDPHLYKASQRDLDKLFDADLVIYQGIFLEGKMNEVLKKFSRTNPVVSVENRLSPTLLLEDEEFEGAFDPHIWFDPMIWKETIENLALDLKETKPEWSEYIDSNVLEYSQTLDSLHTSLQEKIQDLPQDKRILVTAHDAFAYFGRAYGLKVHGLQGLSTLSEPGLNDVSKLVNFIVNNQIKAIFSEQSISPRGVKALVEGCRRRGQEVKLAGPLYTDSLGEKDGPAGTYTDMLLYNMVTIVENLK
ncbi:zinc ABC transporter substrate-binding protein [Litoribacter alkaliphilus]|uniref:Zinc ABC transporter substrate-binding protein n=1 Tax=Litoribacter ruber TaxID=702568 RepID=A0AAP2CL46_9BACT|nr:zinc ABC transporter substrate-binding protein [Litoribacter alkaliphilus]MBS9525774.1 zinc ABC transporter substrate-binding protein [Litoribacter alkaliphilus]